MNTQRATGHPLAVAGVVAASVACSQWASMLLWMPNPRSHMVWFPGAVLLGTLLLQPRRHWWACLLGTAVGEAAAFGVLGVPPLAVTFAMLGSLALTPMVAIALESLRSRLQSPLEDFRLLTAFVVLGGLALPMLSAAWIATAIRGTVLEPYLSDWPNVTLAQSLGNLMLVPAVVWTAMRRRNPVPLETNGTSIAVGVRSPPATTRRWPHGTGWRSAPLPTPDGWTAGASSSPRQSAPRKPSSPACGRPTVG